MGRQAVAQGVALFSPFLLLLLVMILFGSRASRFIPGLFSGLDVHQEGAYTIYFTEGETDPGDAAKTLETFVVHIVGRYGEVLGMERLDPTTSGLKVYLLSSSDALEKFGLQRMNRDLANNGGYFLPAKREIALVLTGNRANDDRGLRHEMMHALMNFSAPEAPWPNWFSEGMASFFEYSSGEGEEWRPGGGPRDRPPAEETLPLKTLLHAGGGDFTSGNNHLFYRSAQMLVEFLFTERRTQLFVFYGRLRDGRGPDAFAETFGNQADLERAWRVYLENRN